MIVFNLNLDVSDRQVLEIKEVCNKQYGDSVVVAPGKVAMGLVDPTIAPIASLVISLIALCLAVRRDLKEARSTKEWTAERFNSVIHLELLKAGVTQYSGLSVENFPALISGVGGPCHVSVMDNATKSRIHLSIFQNGDVYTISDKTGK